MFGRNSTDLTLSTINDAINAVYRRGAAKEEEEGRREESLLHKAGVKAKQEEEGRERGIARRSGDL
jgi:hypothetical protein